MLLLISMTCQGFSIFGSTKRVQTTMNTAAEERNRSVLVRPEMFKKERKLDYYKRSAANSNKWAKCNCSLCQVKKKFSVDEHRHYLLTPRDLTAWVKGLLRYELSSENILDCVAYEVWAAHVWRRSMPPSLVRPRSSYEESSAIVGLQCFGHV